MSFENPQQIIRSWNLQTKFQLGPVLVDKLVPPTFGRIRTNHIKVWREEKLSTQLDYGSKNFSIYLPESLRVLSSVYLKVELPAHETQSYHIYSGLYIIENLRILSGGQEVYNCRYSDFLADYCQSLSEEELNRFSRTYLGGHAVNGDARTLLLPILLPNSAYLGRHGKSDRGNGIFPAFLGQNRLEIQLTIADGKWIVNNASPVAGPSLSDRCSFLYHEVQMTTANVKKYSDMRGFYKIFTRRFTDLTSGWQSYPVADVVTRWTISQPQGLCTELMIIGVSDPGSADDFMMSPHVFVRATSFKCIADNVVQRDLDTPTKIGAELWTNGFCSPVQFPQPARMCFGSHAAESTHMYTGGYVMSNASNVIFEFTFDEAVYYRIVAVQLQKVQIDSDGVMTATLE